MTQQTPPPPPARTVSPPAEATPAVTQVTPLPVAWSLHPECPDLARLGPNLAEATLRAEAARVDAERAAYRDYWGPAGMSRRAFLGGGAAAVAGVGTGLVTARASFGAGPGGALVVVFLRGGLDGLSAIVPADDPALLAARPDIGVRGGSLLPLDRGFGMHPRMTGLHDLWKLGVLTAIPAVSTPEISRSHFQAQDCLERGGSATGAIEGWLDRVLNKMGPGTTFRSVCQGSTLARSMAGSSPTLTVSKVDAFKLGGWEGVHERTRNALTALYTGFDHPLAGAVSTTFNALDTATALNAAGYRPAAEYPEGPFPEGLREIAHLIKGDVGLRVATIDFGGWDHHVHMGKVDDGQTQDMLGKLSAGLAAFATDLGPRLQDTTVVVMTEFGRRVEQNASWGTDHGHGATVLAFGGGVKGGTIHGNWPGLAPEALDQGDVAGANDYRNVLGELVIARLGVSDLGDVFPNHQVQRIGFMA
jgi:uncharacterized protein (DUF1501 family)